MDTASGNRRQQQFALGNEHGSVSTALVDGYWFYERQHAGLGNYFRINLAADIESLAITDGVHWVMLAGRLFFGIEAVLWRFGCASHNSCL